MMKRIEAGLFTDGGNDAVLRMPGRRFPGVPAGAAPAARSHQSGASVHHIAGPGGGLSALVVEGAADGQASGSTSGCVNRTGLPSDRA
ncbi:DUF6959 family protein [Streptomyces fuscichromogenes]|uniref:DUF6959 family protein n=1 Tax=Streptomyces fuscichromogenes TaxID=1324013 RepID=UPI0037FA6497